MTITPLKRASYDPQALAKSRTRVGEGGLAKCEKYKVGGDVWVEKSLLPERQLEYHLRDWLINEAEILATLNGHPSFVRFFGYYTPSGSYHPVLMMEYVDGKPLDAHNGDIGAAVSAGYDSLLGLEVMKDKDIVHRDLTPNNIMLTNSGRGKIIDFGLGRIQTLELAPSGAIFGTPEYMSPEQANGSYVGPESDLFQLAVSLFQVITGRLAVGFFDHRFEYVSAARSWNIGNILDCMNALRLKGLSEPFVDAWGLAVHQIPSIRRLAREPLKKELENLLRRTGSVPQNRTSSNSSLDFEIVEELGSWLK